MAGDVSPVPMFFFKCYFIVSQFSYFTFHRFYIIDWPAVARVSSPRRKGTFYVSYILKNIPTKMLIVNEKKNPTKEITGKK